MTNAIKLPVFVKASLFCIGLYAFISMLYIAQDIIVPLIFGIIIATVLHPVVNFFVRRKINRIVAISITLLLTMIIIAGFGIVMFSQLRKFSESWPVFVEKITTMLNQTIHWVPGYFDISPIKVNQWIEQSKGELFNSGSAVIGQTIISVGNIVVFIFLIPVYVFLVLLYQPLLLNFVHNLFSDDKQSNVNIIISRTKFVIQSYLVGLFIETILVAILNTIGLLVLGIEYAILIGLFGALLNLIPYIGGIVAVSLPMMIALVTKESPMTALYVMFIYIFIQLLDNNIIVPKIVGSKVRINALVSIFVVLAGGALWGIGGMFLSIPLIAIIKVIFDHVESLKPWGILLGDRMPKIVRFRLMTLIKKS